MALSIEEAIARVPQLAHARGVRWSALVGGHSNRNYRVDTDDGSYVIRIDGAAPVEFGLDRASEYAAHRAAADRGIAPEIVRIIEPEGYLVTRFVHRRVPDDMTNPETIRRVADALRRIHALPQVPAVSSPFRFVERAAQTARHFGAALPQDFETLLGGMQDIEAAFLDDPMPICLCHNDFHEFNMLDDGALYILDWEYAGMGDPFFDLGTLAGNARFSDEQERILLEAYTGRATPALHARLKLMEVMSTFREAMWGVIQSCNFPAEASFRELADTSFGLLSQVVWSERWRQWMADLKGEGTN